MKRILFLFACTLFAANAFGQLERPGSIVWNPEVQGKLPESQSVLSIDASLPGRLQHALDSLYAKNGEYGRHGVAASVIVPGLAQWSGATGESYTGSAMTSDLVFEIASNTKTFITALIFKLQEEGKLSINDSLFKWLPSYTYVDSTITIKQLLEHSSGLYDYLNDDTTGQLLNDAYAYHPDRRWTPEEIVSGHLGQPHFKAGTSYRYSNTNFILLGMIAKIAGGKECNAALRERFFIPLGLTHTYAGWADTITEDYAHNWAQITATGPETDLAPIEKTAQLTMANTAGGIISTPTDLAKWAKALYDGSVLNPTSMSQMLTFHVWPDKSVYGRGVVRVPYYTHTFYGHDGHLVGFLTDMFSNPKDSITVVVYMNSEPLSSEPNDPSLNDYIVALLDQIYQPTSSVAQYNSASSVSVYPNPISMQGAISYQLSKSSMVHLAIYDMLGRECKVLLNNVQDAGEHFVNFNTTNLSEGSYLYRLQTSESTLSGCIKIVKE